MIVAIMMQKPPAKRALEAADKPLPATPIAARRISAKVRAAIGFMVNGDCKKICEAAQKAGLARESLSRALSTPHVAEYLRLQTVRRLGIARPGPAQPRSNCSTAIPRSSAIAHPASCSVSPASPRPPNLRSTSMSRYVPVLLLI
jgi:hypothetical protein